MRALCHSAHTANEMQRDQSAMYTHTACRPCAARASSTGARHSAAASATGWLCAMTASTSADWPRWVCTSCDISQGVRAIAHAICGAHLVTNHHCYKGHCSKQPCIPQPPAPNKMLSHHTQNCCGMQHEVQRCCLSANRQQPRTRATTQSSTLYEGICSNCEMVGATTNVPRLHAVRCQGA